MKDYNLNGTPYVVQGLNGELPTSPSADNIVDISTKDWELEFEISMEWNGKTIVEKLESDWNEFDESVMVGLNTVTPKPGAGKDVNSKLAFVQLLREWKIEQELGHVGSFDFKVEIDIDHPKWQDFKTVNIFASRPEIRIYIVDPNDRVNRKMFFLGFVIESKVENDLSNSFYPRLSCHCVTYDQLLGDDDVVMNWKTAVTSIAMIKEVWAKKVTPRRYYGFPEPEVDPTCQSTWDGGFKHDGSFIRFLEILAERENAIWWFDHDNKLHFYKKETLKLPTNVHEININGGNSTSPIQVDTDNYNYCNQVKFRCNNVKGRLTTKTIEAGGASTDGSKDLQLGTPLHSVQSVTGYVSNNGKPQAVTLSKTEDPSNNSGAFYIAKGGNSIKLSNDVTGKGLFIKYTTADKAIHYAWIPMTDGTHEYPFTNTFEGIESVSVLKTFNTPMRWPVDGYQIDGNVLRLAHTYTDAYELQATFVKADGTRVTSAVISAPANPGKDAVFIPMANISNEWGYDSADFRIWYRKKGTDKWAEFFLVDNKYLYISDGEYVNLKATERPDQLDALSGGYKVDKDGSITVSGNIVGALTVTYYEVINALVVKTNQAEVTKERQFRTHGGLWVKDITNDRINTIEDVAKYIQDYLDGHLKHNTTVKFTRYSGNDNIYTTKAGSPGSLITFFASSWTFNLKRRYHELVNERPSEKMAEFPKDIASDIHFFLQKFTVTPFIHNKKNIIHGFKVDYEFVDNQKDDWQNRIQRHEDQRVDTDEDANGTAPIVIDLNVQKDIIANKDDLIGTTAITASDTTVDNALTQKLKAGL